ncbi:MAG: hypothetical protein Kow0032_28850 [Methyloligellaceae bacterium]
MVVFDTTIMLPLVWHDVPPPNDPSTAAPITQYRERIDYLVKRLERDRTKIIVPTPVLSEMLVRLGDAGPKVLEYLNGSASFRPASFDERAAIEVAAMTKRAIDAGDKRESRDGSWAKIKFDRQIIAIAKVERATTVYSDDGGVRAFAKKSGMTVLSSWELPLPEKSAQASIFDMIESDGQEKINDQETK